VAARRFDTLVVGGGSAGCVLAARLSEDAGRSVCLVEAGPDYGPFAGGSWPEDMLDARRLAFSHSWETDVEDRSQLRARILGGCSAHNACVVIAGTVADYDEWGPGWTAAELRPYLERALGELRVRRFGRDELSPWHAAFADAAGADAILHDVNAVGTVRWNTAFAYLDGARGRPNLTILADTLADRIDVRARCLLTSRGPLQAETIVLAAGAYGSPGVLLRSGIGPGLAHDLPVGEGLVDHVGVGLAWEPTAALQEETARVESRHPLYMAQVTVALEERGLFLFPAVDPGYEISGAVFAMKPWSRGRVSLLSPDPRQPLRIEHGFLSDERDAAVLARGVDAIRRLVAQEPLARYAARELRPGEGVDADTHVRAAARGFFHPVGTCAIGRVVDRDGRLVGQEGIVVADASVLPTIPRANTNLSTIAVAEKLAETL
jgi:choline dehydrogenase